MLRQVTGEAYTTLLPPLPKSTRFEFLANTQLIAHTPLLAFHAGFPRDLIISFLPKPAKQTLIRKFAYRILLIVRLLNRSFFGHVLQLDTEIFP